MTPHSALQTLDHRPWPLPSESWRWRQSWRDLLFIHWPVPAATLERHLPGGLALDQFDGTAWIAVVPFRMTGVSLRGVPDLPRLSAFPEINVRTYVTAGGRPGVWFLSLDAANWWAVKAARRLFHLPYYHASMSCRAEAGVVDYSSVRKESPEAEFKGRYWPSGPVEEALPGTLEHWLTERYALYASDGDGTLGRADIHHAPWPLQPATAEVERDTMLAPYGISVAGEPLLHFASRLDVVVWGLQPTG
ncbi:MAG: YqjF family protein [Longimicrobiales bacterium]